MASFIERYHELTKYDPQTIDRLGSVRWTEQPSPYKEIAGQESIDLKPYLGFLRDTDPARWIELGLRPGGDPDLAMLARISWFAAGINAMIPALGRPVYLRATPSAGGLYPTELYWAVWDLPGIEPGLYLFHPLQMALVPVWRGDFRRDVASIFGHHPSVEPSRAVAIATTLFARGAWRYKERAYRRMLLDAGHLLGNLAEAAVAEGLDAVPLSGFVDASLSDLLFLDPEEEVPLYGVAIGGALPPGNGGSARSPRPPDDLLRVPEGVPFQLHAHRLGAIAELPLERLPQEPCAAPLRPGLDYQPLPEPGGLVVDFHPISARRRSCRAYRRGRVPVELFAEVLRWAWKPLIGRPSLGTQDRWLDTWIAVHAVEGLEDGVWHYDPAGHALARVRSGLFRAECASICLGQELGSESVATFFHTSPLAKAVEACGERVYRALCLDAGHIGQRLNLAAAAAGLGFSGIGGYFDDLANELLELPRSEAVLYVSTLGLPAAE